MNPNPHEPLFTAHNIRLDDGTQTKPDAHFSMETNGWFLAAKRVLDALFPGNKSGLRLVDLGCLEGGFAVEFARMGFEVLGIDVRESNIAICNYVKKRVNLPNLEFITDDCKNIAKHGKFDATFCSGLLYHLDKPREFLEILSQDTKRVLILQTHFATNRVQISRRLLQRLPPPVRRVITKALADRVDEYSLSRICFNEGLAGRWYTEFGSDEAFSNREASRWAAWDNRRSFWILREYLLEAIKTAGFDAVFEQYDDLFPTISQAMLRGNYLTEHRNFFIGIKS